MQCHQHSHSRTWTRHRPKQQRSAGKDQKQLFAVGHLSVCVGDWPRTREGVREGEAREMESGPGNKTHRHPKEQQSQSQGRCTSTTLTSLSHTLALALLITSHLLRLFFTAHTPHNCCTTAHTVSNVIISLDRRPRVIQKSDGRGNTRSLPPSIESD